MSCQQGLKKEQIYEPNNRVSTTEFFHQDALCNDESFRFQTIGTIQYNGEDSRFIDFTYERINLSVFKQNVIDDFNKRKVCGFNDWKVSVPQNITGLKCAIFNYTKETQIPKHGDMKYGIYLVEENRLYYGQPSQILDGSTPSKRPTEFRRSIELLFQSPF
ncbi:MAG: hypothetical protein ABL930_02295 [Pseudobdellovibrio sp.]